MIELEILEFSYWEHFKLAKDLALILPLDHSRRVAVDLELNKLIERINKIKNETKQN